MTYSNTCTVVDLETCAASLWDVKKVERTIVMPHAPYNDAGVLRPNDALPSLVRCTHWLITIHSVIY